MEVLPTLLTIPFYFSYKWMMMLLLWSLVLALDLMIVLVITILGLEIMEMDEIGPAGAARLAALVVGA